jgi:protein O-GlcNAc transferase
MILDYQIAPLFLEKKPFDVYMVDGRWRVACVMACFLHAMHCGGDMRKIRVILHDYIAERPNYVIVEKVAKIEQRTGKGILLSKRPDVTEADLYDMWKQYMNIPG